MGARSRTTYKKRQKELARQDKQRDKMARRAERKEGQEDTPEATAAERLDAMITTESAEEVAGFDMDSLSNTLPGEEAEAESEGDQKG